MSAPTDDRAPHGREQPWSDDVPEQGRVVAVTDNPIARAVVQIASLTGRPAQLLADEDVDQMPVDWLADHPLTPADAIVLCDHDTPGMDALLRAALAGEAGYVAMMGSRRRADICKKRIPAQASRRMKLPSLPIRPASSAAGTKRAGGIQPSSG